MSAFLAVVGILLWLFGGLMFVSAPAVTQEMAAVQIFIAGSVLFGAGAIVEAINRAHTTLALAATSANRYMHPSEVKSAGKPVEEFHG